MKYGIKTRDTFGSELDNFRRSFSQLFDDFFAMKPASLFESDWVPEVDMKEDNKALYIRADMPGIEEKNLDVNIENNVLTIKGEKMEERHEENNKKTIFSERRYGSFMRSIRLPEGIKPEGIKAEFKNGVLNIEIPKVKVEEPKKIKININ